MANEFIARNGVIALNNSVVTGSLNVTSGITGSLFGTSSWANNAITASFVTTAQTASFVATSSWANNAITASAISLPSTATSNHFVPLIQTLVNPATLGYSSRLQYSDSTVTLTVTSSWASNVVSASFSTTAATASSVGNLTQNVTITGSLLVSNSIVLTPSGSISVVSGSILALSLTGSLLGTSSWAQNTITASYVSGSVHTSTNPALSASYAVSSSYSLSSSFATTSSFTTTAATASSVGNLTQNITITGSLFVSNSIVLTPSGSISIVSGSINALSITGSLLGTSSWSQNAVTASYVSGSVHTSTNPALSASYALSSSYSLSSSFATTASFTTNAATASFVTQAQTASYLNPLNQGNVIITGSLYISGSGTSLLLGGNVTASTEASLIIGVPPNIGTGEGGQIILQASNVSGWTSASMLDNYQNTFRLLRGNNTSSDASQLSVDMHTGQLTLYKYLNASSFVGTATANLAVDSAGKVITVSTSGGSVFPYTGVAHINGGLVVTGSITSSGAIYSQANNAMYFRGGDDAEFWDINVANTVGIYGQQDQTTAGIKLGSGGGTLTGKNGSIGIGTTTPSPSTLLDVAGNTTISGSFIVTGSARFTGSVSATQGGFTGSLLGTASWANNAVTSSYVSGSVFTSTNPALSASYALSSSYALTSSFTTTSSFATNAATASSVGNLTQNVTITGSLFVSSSIVLTPSGSISVVSGSINALSITGSHLGTSSWANNAVTASYVSGSVHTSANPALSASYTLSSSYSVSSSFVTSASFATTSATASSVGNLTQNVLITGSLLISNSIVLTPSGSISVVSGSINALSITGSLLGTSSWSNNSITASYVSGSVHTSTNPALSASYALSSSYSLTSSFVTSASFATTAATASSVANLVQNVLITGSLFVSNSIVLTPSGSITIVSGSMRALSFTGSLLGTSSWANNVVTAQTASYVNNLNQNLSITGSLVLSGSTTSEFTVLGDQQITGSLFVSNSIVLTPSGSITVVSGSIRALSFTGSILGTSSWAQNVITASYVSGSVHTSTNPALSASYALSSSYSVTSSYALTAQTLLGSVVSAITSSYPFSVGSSILSSSPDFTTIAIGQLAGFGVTSATSLNSNFIGVNAGSASAGSVTSNFIGYQAGTNAGAAQNSNFIGVNAGQYAASARDSNFIGDSAGYSASNASYSTLIGFQAGSRPNASGIINSIGRNNIIIGTNITLSQSRQDSINLGGIIFATGSYYATSGNPFSGSVGNGRVGINVVDPFYNLDVSGSGNYTNGLTVTGSVIISGSLGVELAVRGDTQITGSLIVSNSVNIIGNQLVTGSLIVSNSLNVIGAINFSNGLIVTGSIFPISRSISASIMQITSVGVPGPASQSAGILFSYVSASTTSTVLMIASASSLGPRSQSLYISGNLEPYPRSGSITASFDLGSPRNVWRRLYVATRSVYFVDDNTGISASIGLDANLGFTYNDNPVISSAGIISASYPNPGLSTKAGSILAGSFTGLPETAAVTFTTAFPDTNYSVVVTGEDIRSWTVESKATTGFTINSNSNQGITGTTYWIATSYGETIYN